MKSTATKLVKAIVFVVIGVSVAALGIYVGETDDAPGASLIGILVLVGFLTLAGRAAFYGT